MTTVKFLALSLLFVSCMVQAEVQKASNLNTSAAETDIVGSLWQGASAGFVAGGLTDLLRYYGPNLDSLNLYGNYGICRDQLTGMVKTLSAVAGAKYVSDAQTNPTCNKANVNAKALGVVIGACIASFAKKLAFSCCSK